MPDVLSRAGWTVPVMGQSIRVPFRPAEAWVSALGRGGVETLLLDLAQPASSEVLIDGMATGDLDHAGVAGASQKLIEYATGRRWWEAVRLLQASVRPDVLGRTVLAGMDPWSLTPGQWCAGVYAIFTDGLDKDGLFKFDAMLGDPPEGVDEDDWADEDFDAMVAAARAMPGQR